MKTTQNERRDRPVREGDELDVKIQSVGSKGDGVYKKQGFVIFIPQVKLDEECRIRITRVTEKVAFGVKLDPN